MPSELTPPCVLAVDIGGTKLAAAVVDGQGTVHVQRRTATPTTDGEALYATLLGLCREVLAVAGGPVLAIGVGCPGPMRFPAGVVSPLNMPAWRQFPLKRRLEESFCLPCAVDNDAKAIALGEHWRGAGQGLASMMGMVVSTGVGGGIVVEGKLVHGASGNAGHIGHVIVWPGGPRCECGARGCVEAIASGTSITRRLAALMADGRSTALAPGADAAEIAAAARAGDPLGQELYRDAGEVLGRGIASAAALLDLELVAIGGSVALHAWDLLGPPLERELRAMAGLDFSARVRVTPAALGEAGGLIGAAALGLALLDD